MADERDGAEQPIEPGEPARATAAELAAVLRRAAAELPFGLEPQDLLQALERLAEPEPGEGEQP